MKFWHLIAFTYMAIVVFFFFYDKYKEKTKKGKNTNYVKYGITKETLESLADYEQERKPELSRKKARRWALDRIEKDNR